MIQKYKNVVKITQYVKKKVNIVNRCIKIRKIKIICYNT